MRQRLRDTELQSTVYGLLWLCRLLCNYSKDNATVDYSPVHIAIGEKNMTVYELSANRV